MTNKELKQKAHHLMILFLEFLTLEELEQFTKHDGNLTKLGNRLQSKIKKWLKENIVK
tara:strand:- start:51 stop:224 length:174 start_codon:yes stop_codon:yes gene_type:complete